MEISAGELRFEFCFRKPDEFSDRGHAGLFIDYFADKTSLFRRYPFSKRVALLSEPNASLPFVAKPRLARNYPLILTHDSRLVSRGKPYREFPFGTTFVEHLLDAPGPFHKHKLLSMIGALHPDPKAGHVLRNQVIERMRSREDIDCFGRGVRWIESKEEGLKDYAFSIAIENCFRDFYFSEKILDCFLTETVPIYCGCPSIDRYFDPRGFLRFDSLEELEKLLPRLTWDLYREMLPFVRKNCEKAIQERWMTRSQMFERMGKEIQLNLGSITTRAPKTIWGLLGEMKWRLKRVMY